MKRLQVMVTQRCNSSCSYCMVARAGKDLEEGVLDRLPDILAEGDFDVVMLFGGEPLLREDLCYAIKEKSGGRKIMLPTNGKLLTDRHIADFGHVLISANGTAESCRLTGQSSVPAILRLAAKDRCTIGMRIIPETAARMKEDFDYFHAAGFSKYNIVPIIELDWDEAAYQHYRQGVEYILAKIPREQIWTWKQGGICVPYHGTTCLDQTGQLWGCARFYSERRPVPAGIKERHFGKCLHCAVRRHCFHNCGYLNQCKTGAAVMPDEGVCRFAKLYQEILA